MSSSSASPEPDPSSRLSRQDQECLFWVSVFQQLGMQTVQAQRLGFDSACDRHGVRDALERGCDPDLCFLIYS